MFKIKIAIHDSDVVISTLSVFANSNKLLSIGIMICRKTIKGVLCRTWNLLCYDKVLNSILYWPIKTWNKFSTIWLHHANYLNLTMGKLITWNKTQRHTMKILFGCCGNLGLLGIAVCESVSDENDTEANVLP